MTPAEAAIQTATLSLYRFDALPARLWVFAQMGLSRLAMARLPDCSFWKLCGSGIRFLPRPDTAVWAILAVWPDLDTARQRLALRRPFTAWSKRADETCTLFLQPTAARGRWSGRTPFAPHASPGGPVAALTRGSIRLRALPAFWRRVPDISDVIGDDPEVLFKIGIGEVPWLHQVTFSIWPDAASMARFARRDGPHARAIAAVRAGDWFSEDLYVRFNVVDTQGRWNGHAPLARTKVAA